MSPPVNTGSGADRRDDSDPTYNMDPNAMEYRRQGQSNLGIAVPISFQQPWGQPQMFFDQGPPAHSQIPQGVGVPNYNQNQGQPIPSLGHQPKSIPTLGLDRHQHPLGQQQHQQQPLEFQQKSQQPLGQQQQPISQHDQHQPAELQQKQTLGLERQPLGQQQSFGQQQPLQKHQPALEIERQQYPLALQDQPLGQQQLQQQSSGFQQKHQHVDRQPQSVGLQQQQHQQQPLGSLGHQQQNLEPTGQYNHPVGQQQPVGFPQGPQQPIRFQQQQPQPVGQQQMYFQPPPQHPHQQQYQNYPQERNVMAPPTLQSIPYQGSDRILNPYDPNYNSNPNQGLSSFASIPPAATASLSYTPNMQQMPAPALNPVQHQQQHGGSLKPEESPEPVLVEQKDSKSEVTAPPPRLEIITGVVTQMHDTFGMISGEVLFHTSAVVGVPLKIGDKVVVEAERVTGMPFKFNGKRVQIVSQDFLVDSIDTESTTSSQETEQEPPKPAIPTVVKPLKSILKMPKAPPPPIYSKPKTKEFDLYRPESPVGLDDRPFVGLNPPTPFPKIPVEPVAKSSEKTRSYRKRSPEKSEKSSKPEKKPKSPERSSKSEKKAKSPERSSKSKRSRSRSKERSKSKKSRSRSPDKSKTKTKRSRSRSPAKSSSSKSKRSRSPEKSSSKSKRSRTPERTRSKRSRTPEKSRKRSKTPEKSRKRSRTPEKSSKSRRSRSRTPEKSSKSSKSKRKSRSRSPEKSSKSKSSRRSRSRSRTPEKSRSKRAKSKSPRKKSRSPSVVVISPHKPPSKPKGLETLNQSQVNLQDQPPGPSSLANPQPNANYPQNPQNMRPVHPAFASSGWSSSSEEEPDPPAGNRYLMPHPSTLDLSLKLQPQEPTLKPEFVAAAKQAALVASTLTEELKQYKKWQSVPAPHQRKKEGEVNPDSTKYQNRRRKHNSRRNKVIKKQLELIVAKKLRETFRQSQGPPEKVERVLIDKYPATAVATGTAVQYDSTGNVVPPGDDPYRGFRFCCKCRVFGHYAAECTMPY